MVLAERVGKKRGFWRGFALTVLTFGIYAVYWHYKAHNELYRQFELQREGRSDGMIWYVLGLTVPPFLLAYFWVMGENVEYLRRRIGLPRGQSPARFLALVGAGATLFVAALIVMSIQLSALPEDASAEQTQGALQTAGLLYLALMVVAGGIVGFGYAGLQRDMNELWDAYAARLQWLATHPSSPFSAAAAAGAVVAAHASLAPAHAAPAHAAGAPSYQPAPSAPPPFVYHMDPPAAPAAAPAYDDRPMRLRSQAMRLRDEHPDLLALDRLDALLALAERGDGFALEEAQALLADVDALLEERRGLLARQGARPEGGADLEERLAALEAALFRQP